MTELAEKSPLDLQKLTPRIEDAEQHSADNSIEKLRLELEQQKEACKKKKDKVSNLKSLLQEAKQEITRLQQTGKAVTEIEKDLREDLRACNEDEDEEIKVLAKYKAELQARKDKLKAREAELEACSDKKETPSANKELKNRLKEKDETIKALEEAYDSLQETNETLKDKLSAKVNTESKRNVVMS